MMILSIKDRLEARISIGQIIPFIRLLKIMKSIGHSLYIEHGNRTHIDYVDSFKYPQFIKIISVVEKENQIWDRDKMIMATVVKIEGVK